MSKNIYTSREELVCGKIELLENSILNFKGVGDNEKVAAIDALRDIQYDCQRMEAKLISRKEQAENMTTLTKNELSLLIYGTSFEYAPVEDQRMIGKMIKKGVGFYV